MEDQPSTTRFNSSEELMAFLREHCDDVDVVTIPIPEALEIRDPQGQRRKIPAVGAILKLCNGKQTLLHHEDATMLLNDGILSRLKIPCKLDDLSNKSNDA